MKVIEKYEAMKPVYTEIHWGDHWPGCEKCRKVDVEKSVTFPYSCAQGAVLLAEELAKRQAPVVREKTAAVRQWAKETGGFPEFDKGNPEFVKRVTKYK